MGVTWDCDFCDNRNVSEYQNFDKHTICDDCKEKAIRLFITMKEAVVEYED